MVMVGSLVCGLQKAGEKVVDGTGSRFTVVWVYGAMGKTSDR